MNNRIGEEDTFLHEQKNMLTRFFLLSCAGHVMYMEFY